LVNPRIFWRDHQDKFSIFASLARDILSISATGSGIERLFNSARDICHYRRGLLKPKTIKDLIILMYTTRFDVESEQLILIEEYLSIQEIHTVKEKKNTQKEKNEFDFISDGEDDSLDTGSQYPQRSCERVLGKRPRKEATPPSTNQRTLIQLDNEDNENNEDNEDNENSIPLPDNSGLLGESSTHRRTSGRVSKRARRDEDLFVYQKP